MFRKIDVKTAIIVIPTVIIIVVLILLYAFSRQHLLFSSLASILFQI